MPTPHPTGYNPDFLGIPAPMPTAPGVTTVPLAYTHFSTLHRPDRRLAAATAVTIDGATLRDVERSDDWRPDDRLPHEQQAGEEIYADNDLDRGHLVRRQDPVWGEQAEAERAESETFFYTNAAPQASSFNQDRELWLGLEDYLLDNAADHDRKLVVFTGPVLTADDPQYRDLQIPLQFWKIGGFITDGALGTTGYLLEQTPSLATCSRTANRRRWGRSEPSRSPSPGSPSSPVSTSAHSRRPPACPSPSPRRPRSPTTPSASRPTPTSAVCSTAHAVHIVTTHESRFGSSSD